MIDRDAVATGMVKVVRDTIGSRLATFDTPTGSKPCVIKARQGGPKPDLPNVVIDPRNFTLPSGWLLDKYFDINNVMQYDVLYELFIDIECRGEDSYDILQEFHSYLSLPSVTDYIRGECLGGSVQQQGDVIDTPDLLDTDFEEGATLTMSLYIVDTIQDPLGVGIERILDATGSGTLITGANGDITVPIDTQTI